MVVGLKIESNSNQMKQFYYFLFIGLLSVTVSAQNLQRSSLGSSGASSRISSSDNMYYVSQSVGQKSVIGTLINGENAIRQGFQQPPIQVEVYSETNTDIQAVVFPNPVDAFITIQFNEELKNPIQVEIFDVLGKLMINTSENPTNSFKINMTHLATGTYFLNLSSGNRKFTARLIKK